MHPCYIFGGMRFKLPKLVDAKLIARRYGVKREWVEAETAAGRLPGVRAGDTWLFDVEAVERTLLARAKRQGKGGAK